MEIRKGRILLVEADPYSRYALTALLRSLRYHVFAASSLMEGLTLAKTGSFDLYVIVYWLPDGVGLDLCRLIRTFDSITPILFYAAASAQIDKMDVLAAGAQGYLVKPASLADMRQAISALRAGETFLINPVPAMPLTAAQNV